MNMEYWVDNKWVENLDHVGAQPKYLTFSCTTSFSDQAKRCNRLLDLEGPLLNVQSFSRDAGKLSNMAIGAKNALLGRLVNDANGMLDEVKGTWHV